MDAPAPTGDTRIICTRVGMQMKLKLKLKMTWRVEAAAVADNGAVGGPEVEDS